MTKSIQAVVAVPPLLGRAGHFRQAKTFQLFASIRNNQQNGFIVPDLNILQEGWMARALPQVPDACGGSDGPYSHDCERLWRLGTAAQVAFRESRGPYTPMTPSQLDALDNPENPVFDFSVGGGSGYFRVLYTLSTTIGKHSFFLDVGEMIEVYAKQINATLVGPADTVNITQLNEATSASPVTRDGLVVDARIGAMLVPIESPTGLREANYTQIIPVPIATAVDITVPKFAKRIHVYQDNVGFSSGDWTRFVGPPTACPVGTLAFDGRASRELDARIGRESTFRTDINNLNARLFQVQWTIRP